MNQVQFNPFVYRRRLLEAYQERGVALEAYSPLGTGEPPRRAGEEDRATASAARRQVLLRWCVQRISWSIRSRRTERIEDARIFDFTLSDEDVAALDALDATDGTERASNAVVVRRATESLRSGR